MMDKLFLGLQGRIARCSRFSTSAKLLSNDSAFDAAAFRDNISRFIDKELVPYAAEIDQQNNFSRLRVFWRQLGEMGLHGLTVPEKYGGSGLGYEAHLIAMEEVSRGSASIGLSYGAHSNLCVNQIQLNGNEAQKLKYLPRLVSGEHIGALAMSETGAGSDVTSMKISAIEQEDGDYLLNGSKFWITNGPDADVLVVYAKTSHELGKHGITAFLIERQSPGFSSGPKLDKFGMRGSNTCELIFDNVRVPRENILGDLNKGVYVLMKGLDYERLVLSGGPLGIMQAALDAVLPYVSHRNQFGKNIAEFQLIQAKIADMYLKLKAARSLSYSVAKDLDNGINSREDCAGAILFASERSVELCLEAIQCLGGNGYTNEYPVGRLLRDAKLYDIGAGTNEIRRLLIAKELLKK